MTDAESPEETRRRWPAVTAVAATVVLLAGGLYGLGQAREGGGTGAADAPLALDGPTAEGAAKSLAVAGPLELRGEPPAAPDAAAVYHFDDPGVDAGRVAELAAALGLDGEPVAAGGSWSVSGSPETGRPGGLLVAEEAPGHWVYSVDGAGALTAPGDPDASVSSDAMPPAGGEPAPSVETALATAEPLFAELLGEEVAGALDDGGYDAGEVTGSTRTVRAEPLVDGLPVAGMEIVLGIGPGGGLVTAAGSLGVPTAGEERPVTGAAEALARVNEGSGAAAAREIGDPCLMPEPGGLAPALGEAAEELALDCPRPTPGPVEPLPVSAELGLSLVWSEGSPLLVPAWLFRTDEADGRRLTLAEPAVEYQVGPVADGAGDAVDSEEPGDAEPGDSEPAEAGAEPSEGDGSEPGVADGSDGAEVGPVEPDTLPTGGLWVAGHASDTDTLTVHFWGGVCDTYEVRATESADEVVLTVAVVDPDPERVCVMMAEQHVDEVTLDAPVGDRALLDERGEPLTVR
ncbi:hypothetical protein RM844_01290 [Streptomyces sp. DSM 44915]|uniref:Large membrane protein n=1 Tax=Streptomyces chisholmiae TaxID=3075540 RepID=A0ABU2JIU2_9ACTN|nr:hypothetical protein [Streptomyces sp. DSM 44915]MDT0264915.1 hypothetical protein [Streptomyces sp. DSM 44915]